VAWDEPQVSVGGLLVQAILGKMQQLMKAVRKWTRKGVCWKTGKNNSVEKEGKSKEGRRMQINEENNWILDQPHCRELESGKT
jgi:hypothetical protein